MRYATDRVTGAFVLLMPAQLSFDFLDINCGCPIDLVYNKGMGSALLERVNRLEVWSDDFALSVCQPRPYSGDTHFVHTFICCNVPVCAALTNNATFQSIARSVHSVLDKPMTIKIRIGRDEKNPTVHKNIVPFVHLWGASALTVRS